LTVALGEASGALLILQTALLVEIGNGAMFAHLGLTDLASRFVALLAAIAVRAAVTWAARLAAFECASGLKQTLREELTAHLREIGPIALAGMRAGEIANVVVDGVEALDPYYSRYLPQRAIATLLPFTILAVVYPLDWMSGLALTLTALFLPASMIVIGEESHERNRQVWGKLSEISGRFLDVLRGLPTLKMFGAAQAEAAEIARSTDEYRRTSMSALRIAFLSSFMLELITAASIAVVAVLAGFRLLSGSMRFAPGYFVLLIAPEYFLTFRALGTFYHSRMAAVSAAERIGKLLDSEALRETRATRSIGPRDSERGEPTPGPLAPAVTFDRVSFAYSTGTVLDGATFAIAGGEHVAVSGASGAGKSTILNILLRFLAPDGGRVTIDEQDLERFERSRWLERIAWLPQRPTLFHGTLAENIRLGRLAAGDGEVREAARLAGVDEFLERLPLGLETPLGERGLAVGQIQRVALARLFLRDPALVLLDEPTAHLDPESERLVNEGIRTLSRGRTMIVAAHRRATEQVVDRVLVVDGGRVLARAGRRAAR